MRERLRAVEVLVYFSIAGPLLFPGPLPLDSPAGCRYDFLVTACASVRLVDVLILSSYAVVNLDPLVLLLALVILESVWAFSWQALDYVKLLADISCVL